MKIDKSFQSPQQQAPQQPLQVELVNEVKLPEGSNQQLLKENQELLKKLQEKEELIKKLEQKTQNTQSFLENTVKVLTQKTILLKETEEKLKTSQLPQVQIVENPDVNTLKTEVYLAKEQVQDLQKKLEKMSIFQKVVENISSLNHSEHILSQLIKEESLNEKEKVSKITKVLSDKVTLKNNEIKITLNSFQPEDIVLFIKDSHGNWEIFNRNASGFYLSLEIVEQLKKKQEYKDLISVVGQILFIESEQTATKNNPFGFAVGRKYSVVHIYPFQ